MTALYLVLSIIMLFDFIIHIREGGIFFAVVSAIGSAAWAIMFLMEAKL